MTSLFSSFSGALLFSGAAAGFAAAKFGAGSIIKAAIIGAVVAVVINGVVTGMGSTPVVSTGS